MEPESRAAPVDAKVVDLLSAAKAEVLRIARPQAQRPGVAHNVNHIVTKLDEAYMWCVVGLRPLLEQGSETGVEAAVAEAQRDGKLVVLPPPKEVADAGQGS